MCDLYVVQHIFIREIPYEMKFEEEGIREITRIN